MTETNNYAELYQHLKPTFIGNHLPWLRTARDSSLKHFLATGFPNRHQEDWKYTDLSFLTKEQFSWAPRNDTVTPQMLETYQLANTEAHQLVFIDGYFSPALSKIQNLPVEVTLSSLNEILLNDPDSIKNYFEDKTENNAELTNLNTAFITDGFFLQIPKNIRVTNPIHFLFLSTDNVKNILSNTRNIILLEENAEAILLEEHAALDSFQNNEAHSTHTKNIYTQIFLKHNAHLHFHKLQHENKNNIHLAYTKVTQAKDTQLHHHTISLGSKLARDNLTIALDEPGAFCELNGFYALADTQHIDHHTRIDHFAPQTHSKEYYKGILQDKSKGVFNGKVIVHPHAQKINSQQMNKNLLLSKLAEMNTKPELEIYADDVRCTHGATVGEIDTDALFFLRSRGFDKNAAMALLIQGFYEDVLGRIQQPDIASYIRDSVTKTLL